MIETGTLLQNRYLIEKQIGEGGMGAVYVAIDRRFGSRVAIKETFFKDDELGAAFEREAHLLNSLHHPVLPHVSDYFAENNGYFLVMQFIEGEDLFETLKREGAFPVKDVLRWTDNLLDALDYLHSQQIPIIHRDIKPQNLKITTRGDIILLDFGLAKLNSEDSSVEKSIFGYSRKYSPLEQIQGTGTDVRSDIFSLAATAYHLLTGKPAIEVIARASEIVHGNPDPLRLASEINNEIPVGIANVLNSALALNAIRRFASAKAMRQALEHAVHAIPVACTEELPKSLSAVVGGSYETINSVEIENFTALESFAADAAVILPQTDKNKELAAVETPISNAVTSTPAPETAPQESYVGDMRTNVIAHANPFRFRFAALTALLICSALGTLYFITKTSSSNKSNPNPAAQSSIESNLNTGQSAAVSDAPPAKVIETSVLENTEQTKPKPSLTKRTLEKKEPVEKEETTDKPTTQVETIEKPKTAAPTATNSPSIAARTPRRSESRPRIQTRPRVADTPPAPDIESIFTGRPSGQRDEMQQRREKRRQNRRQSQNGNAIPF